MAEEDWIRFALWVLLGLGCASVIAFPVVIAFRCAILHIGRTYERRRREHAGSRLP